MNCEWVKENVTLYVYDELADDARHEVDQHARRCPDCALELKAVRNFTESMNAVPQLEVTPNLLTSARMSLQEALETAEQARGWARFTFDPFAWLRQVRFAPALAAVLLMVGFGAGIGTGYKVAKSKTIVPGGTGGPEIHQPQEASIAGIRNIVQQPGSNQVQIQYDKTFPEQVTGSADDPKIQQLLLYAAKNNYNSGLRMDSIDLLKDKPQDDRVREALVFALRYDSNPGVRLKAEEGLAPFVKQDIRVRNAMLEALLNDNNPGVRQGAMKALENVKTDTSVRQALQQLSQDDPNQFIRSESRRLLASVPHID
jgi:hypothetical protein